MSALPAVLGEMTGRLKRRGMVIVISDCFGDVKALKEVLGQYRHLGHDVLVFQILAPEELTFPFRREAFFQDLELPGRMQVNPNTIRKAYLEEFQKFHDPAARGDDRLRRRFVDALDGRRLGRSAGVSAAPSGGDEESAAEPGAGLRKKS